MPLKQGTTLGHYEILELIGQGGMGEVYGAQDATLGRDVAIKVLPEELARDKERLDRFKREARLLAKLNHANIATLHGLEEHDGRWFLVMELVEGETLAERISRGPIPMDEAIPLFIQIAEGLEAAHEKSIVHRDLKPANIKIGPNGEIKILDFGLARVAEAEAESSGGGDSRSPTLTKGTALGVILGTASYMSPEQARGKSVDKKTDIWAFGCCLYEALTGKKAFEGETVTDILAAVVKTEPDWSAIPAAAASNITKLVRRALRKNPTERLHDIADARLELAEPEAPPGESPNVGGSGGRFRNAVAIGASLVFGVLGGSLLFRSSSPADTMRFSIRFDQNQLLLPGARGAAVALSPDGRRMVFSAGRVASRRLFRRDMGSLEALAIPGTEGGEAPFFSRDGNLVGFFANGKLKKLSLSDNSVVTLCDVASHSGGSWGKSGRIIYATFEPPHQGALWQIPAEGGVPERLDTESLGEHTYSWPQLLPGEEYILVTARASEESYYATSVLAVHRETGREEVILDRASHGRYVPSGHLLFGFAGNLWAQPFDASRARLLGEPVQVLEQVVMDPTDGSGQYAVSSAGVFAYVPGLEYGTSDRGALVWVRRDGAVRRLTKESRLFSYPRLSPDESRLVMVIRGADLGDLWFYDLTRETLDRFTSEGDNFAAVWSPDGRTMAFLSSRSGEWKVYSQPVDGSERVAELLPTTGLPHSWDPDGRYLTIFRHDDLHILTADGSGQLEDVATSPFLESSPMFSPDGDWIVYCSNDSGRFQVYVRARGEGPRIPVSKNGGTEPMWSRRGDEIFYRQGTRMMSVPVERGSELTLAEPSILFEGAFAEGQLGVPNYDVTSDGQEFVMVVQDESAGVSQINVVLNWDEELKRLVPTDR